MDIEEFVTKIKRYSIDDTIRQMTSELQSPKLTRVNPASQGIVQESMEHFFAAGNERSKRDAEWFGRLSPDDQNIFRQLLEKCSELTLFNAFCFLDGVGGDSEGVFEIVECVEQRSNNVLNPVNSSMLHDLLSDVVAEHRRQAESHKPSTKR